MHRWAQSSALGVCSVCVALVTACNHDTEVQRQTRELEQAQKEVPEVTAQLEKDLTRARGDVAHLEGKLALARQGLTDDVIENQRELEQALKDQQQQVRTELGEAQREAEIHDRDTAAALAQLQQTGTMAAAPPPAEPAAGSAPPPAAPATTPEPVHPNDVVRVHGEDADAGADDEMAPPSSPAPTGPAPSTPAPSLAMPPAADPAPGPAPSTPLPPPSPSAPR
jgi:TolA-binding protein